MKYIVDVKEAWIQTWEIEANSPEEAREKALNGIGKELRFEYSETPWRPCVSDANGEKIILDFEK